MNSVNQETIMQFLSLMENVDERMKGTFQNMHHGYPTKTLVRFLKAREWNVQKAHKLLIECLQWRIQNEIDNILAKPIIPTDLYRAVRDSQLVGLSGYSKEGLPVIAIGVGLSTFDKASVNYYVKSHIQMNEYRDRVVLPTATKKSGQHINTCLKAVKPLLQERTKRKIQVLQGCGRDELLKIMDYSSLPHFCGKEGSGSSRHSSNGTRDNCFSLDHTFHQQLYNYIKQQAMLIETGLPIRQGSVHVDFPVPDPEDTRIAKTIQCEFHRPANPNGLCNH
ncbi:hypothetical protein CRYUN_Cryun11dG0007700 [Craigia yunnanensis]